MNFKIKFLALIVSLLLSSTVYCQYSNKENLYFHFNEEIKDCVHDHLKLKLVKKNITQFNLCGKAVLLSSNNLSIDTLSMEKLKSFNFSKANDIDEIVTAWRESNEQSLKIYYNGVYPFFDKNAMFNTYIVEVIENQNCIVVYSVTWAREGAVAFNN